MQSPYQPLDPEDQQIRVAVLEPGSGSDAIKIRLRVESLLKDNAEEPQFEALSYAWGNELSPHTIQVHDHVMSVGLNLEQALRQFRYPDKERILWVDALCINQADVHERNSQVQIMGRIYSSANTVLVWLGCEDQADVEAMEMIMKTKFLDYQVFQTLTRIFERPWFCRVWVVQEFILARNDPMMYVGAFSIPWQAFLQQIIRHMGRRTPAVVAHFRTPDEPRLLYSWQFKRAMSNFLKLGRMRFGEPRAFAENLHFTSSFKATDPRDKVFGILGLHHPPTDPVQVTPDYDKTISEVLIDTSMSMIKHDPLGLYGRFPLNPLRDEHMSELCSLSSLPTWALDPDINTRYAETIHNYNQPENMLQRFNLHIPQRTCKFQSPTRFSPDNVLHTVGTSFGTILYTSGELLRSTRDEFKPENLRLGIMHVMDRIYETMLKPRNLQGEDLWLTFVRNPQFLALEERRRRLFTKRGPPFNKTIFVTSNSHVGLTYHPDMLNGIRPGDVVVGLFGVSLPFVLRKVEQSNQYQIINVASVSGHDLYHPELEGAAEGTTEDDVWEDLDRYGLQEYKII